MFGYIQRGGCSFDPTLVKEEKEGAMDYAEDKINAMAEFFTVNATEMMPGHELLKGSGEIISFLHCGREKLGVAQVKVKFLKKYDFNTHHAVVYSATYEDKDGNIMDEGWGMDIYKKVKGGKDLVESSIYTSKMVEWPPSKQPAKKQRVCAVKKNSVMSKLEELLLGL